jgi:hypothetical protein
LGTLSKNDLLNHNDDIYYHLALVFTASGSLNLYLFAHKRQTLPHQSADRCCTLKHHVLPNDLEIFHLGSLISLLGCFPIANLVNLFLELLSLDRKTLTVQFLR